MSRPVPIRPAPALLGTPRLRDIASRKGSRSRCAWGALTATTDCDAVAAQGIQNSFRGHAQFICDVVRRSGGVLLDEPFRVVQATVTLGANTYPILLESSPHPVDADTEHLVKDAALATPAVWDLSQPASFNLASSRYRLIW